MLVNHELNQKTNFYIRLCLLIMVFLFLVGDLITAIYFPIPRYASLSYGERISAYYAYFTTQSNYMVFLYFAIYLYNYHFHKKLPNFLIRLAVTVYITVTMLIFWLGIATAYQNLAQYNVYRWFDTIILHLIMPVVMIISFFFNSGQQRIMIKKWHHNQLWLLVIYPLIYGIIIELRGNFRRLDWINSGKQMHLPDTWYPYPFLDWYAHLGPLIVIFSFVIILFLIITLQYLYLLVNNLMYNKKILLLKK